MKTPAEKAQDFVDLHAAPGCFVIPNPWDRGTARMLAKLGYKALATTSAGYDFVRGEPEGTASRDDMLAHCAELAAATDLPVNADLEAGYATTPEGVADTIRLAARAGLAGGSIEDFTGDPAKPIYDQAEAVDRLSAAVEAKRGLDRPFVLTARAENHFRGVQDLDDTIRRLQAFQEAGADVLYCPGIKTAEQVRAVISSVDRPVNVIAGISGMTLTVADLADLGVKRVSVGSGLYRAAMGAAMRAAEEMAGPGTFTYTQGQPTIPQLSALFTAD